MNNKALFIKRIIMTLLTVFVIFFIFYNSSLNAEDSTVHSTGVREFINNLLSSLGFSVCLSENLVRKCAHFAEYFVLGNLLYFTVKLYTKKLMFMFLLPFTVGFLTAVIDETIQLFSIGRSAQFFDVLLDFTGVCTAVLFFYFVYKIFNRNKDSKEE